MLGGDSVERIPSSPFPGARPEIADDLVGVYVWFTEPPGMVVRYISGLFFDVDVAMYVTTKCEAALRRRFPGAAKLSCAHDFWHTAGYSTTARQIMTDWGTRAQGNVAKCAVVSPTTNAVMRMGIGTAAAMLRLAGLDIQIVDSMAEAVKVCGMRACGPR